VRLERPACWHRFCTITGHFQAALEDSSVWTIVRLTTDPVTCPWSFAYGRINTVVNNNNNSENKPGSKESCRQSYKCYALTVNDGWRFYVRVPTLVHVKDCQWVVICEHLKVDDAISGTHLPETTFACLPIHSVSCLHCSGKAWVELY